MLEMNQIYNMDCMEGMKQIPDKYFELAIVDPPYFEGAGDPAYYRSRTCSSNAKPITETWSVPDKQYFDELFRVSKKQIVWGCNYYAQYIPHTSRIVWDKVNDGTPFSQAEIASWSDGVKVYIFRYKWNGMIQQNMGANKETRFHPTQKPVSLYQWTLREFAKKGWKILDTHMGSGSSIIACHDMGFEYMAFEIDKDYYEAAKKRIDQHKAQVRMVF